MIYHTGQTASYVGVLKYFPDHKLSIAWLSNTTEFEETLFDEITAIEDLLMKVNPPDEREKTTKPQTIGAKKLQLYTGWYQHGKNNQGMKITLQHDTLLFENTPLAALKDYEFKYKASTITFNNNSQFVLTTPDKRQIPFTKGKPAPETVNYLKEFRGTYYSKETGTSLNVNIEAGKLMLNQGYIRNVLMLPTYKDGFNFLLNGSEHANAFFQRDKRNKVFAFELSTYNARKLKFTRIQ